MSNNLIVQIWDKDDDLSDDEGIGCNNCYACVSGGRLPCQNQPVICIYTTDDKDFKEITFKEITIKKIKK